MEGREPQFEPEPEAQVAPPVVEAVSQSEQETEQARRGRLIKKYIRPVPI